MDHADVDAALTRDRDLARGSELFETLAAAKREASNSKSVAANEAELGEAR